MTERIRSDSVGEPLRAAWLKQIRVEFEDICYQHRVDLQAPIFELTDSSTRFGSWDHQYRIIALSTRLISGHPWQITLQVLKHEIAHQICSDIFAAPSEGHGPLFKKACAQLGLSGPFSRAKADYTGFSAAIDPAVSPEAEQGRRVLAKVEKLLALAGSDNEHEAALAMQRAGELLRRHNLELSSPDDPAYLHLSLNTGRQRMPGYLRSVCALLQEYFFVQIVCASVYDPQKDVSLRTIELFGRRENVVVAEHCYHFLTGKLASLWQRNRHRFPRGGQRARNSYFHGVIVGFREKLADGRRQCSGSVLKAEADRALIPAEDVRLQNFVAIHFPRLRKGGTRKIRLNADAYRDAVATGRTLVLHRAMEESSTDGGLLE